MLTRKPSVATDDAQDGGPLFTRQGMPSVFAIVPPASTADPRGEGGQPEACRLVSVNLSAYLDGELDPDQARLVENHLNTCPNCADLLVETNNIDF